MNWTTNKPTVSGYYWIYTIPEWDNDPTVMIVFVSVINGVVSFDIPKDGYECEEIISPDRTTHWMGVVEKPEPPAPGEVERNKHVESR